MSKKASAKERLANLVLNKPKKTSILNKYAYNMPMSVKREQQEAQSSPKQKLCSKSAYANPTSDIPASDFAPPTINIIEALNQEINEAEWKPIEPDRKKRPKNSKKLNRARSHMICSALKTPTNKLAASRLRPNQALVGNSNTNIKLDPAVKDALKLSGPDISDIHIQLPLKHRTAMKMKKEKLKQNALQLPQKLSPTSKNLEVKNEAGEEPRLDPPEIHIDSQNMAQFLQPPGTPQYLIPDMRPPTEVSDSPVKAISISVPPKERTSTLLSTIMEPARPSVEEDEKSPSPHFVHHSPSKSTGVFEDSVHPLGISMGDGSAGPSCGSDKEWSEHKMDMFKKVVEMRKRDSGRKRRGSVLLANKEKADLISKNLGIQDPAVPSCLINAE